jgi:hypothetical protein
MMGHASDALRRYLPPCPMCGAATGDPCRTPRDKTRKPHAVRGTFGDPPISSRVQSITRDDAPRSMARADVLVRMSIEIRTRGGDKIEVDGKNVLVYVTANDGQPGTYVRQLSTLVYEDYERSQLNNNRIKR